MKLKLSYVRDKNGLCIKHPHYDLYTEEEEGLPINVACILVEPEDVKVIKKMVELYNKHIDKRNKACGGSYAN